MSEVVSKTSSSINKVSYDETKTIINAPEESAGDKEKPIILLVEDNFELSNFIKDSLKAKYNIELAENGKIGFEKVISNNPDIVISDVMMPIMDGYKLCETIKSDEKYNHLPVVLLTAKSNAEHRIQGYNLGADGYISKPFSMEVLQARIDNLLESRKKLRQKLREDMTIEPSKVTSTSMDEQFLSRVLRIIEKNYARNKNLWAILQKGNEMDSGSIDEGYQQVKFAR